MTFSKSARNYAAKNSIESSRCHSGVTVHIFQFVRCAFRMFIIFIVFHDVFVPLVSDLYICCGVPLSAPIISTWGDRQRRRWPDSELRSQDQVAPTWAPPCGPTWVPHVCAHVCAPCVSPRCVCVCALCVCARQCVCVPVVAPRAFHYVRAPCVCTMHVPHVCATCVCLMLLPEVCAPWVCPMCVPHVCAPKCV